jgi:di/tricarboxylate transporter
MIITIEMTLILMLIIFNITIIMIDRAMGYSYNNFRQSYPYFYLHIITLMITAYIIFKIHYKSSNLSLNSSNSSKSESP